MRDNVKVISLYMFIRKSGQLLHTKTLDFTQDDKDTKTTINYLLDQRDDRNVFSYIRGLSSYLFTDNVLFHNNDKPEYELELKMFLDDDSTIVLKAENIYNVYISKTMKQMSSEFHKVFRRGYPEPRIHVIDSREITKDVIRDNQFNFMMVCQIHKINSDIIGGRRNVEERPCVYMHLFPNGKAYVGSTRNPVRRWNVSDVKNNELNDYNSEFTKDMWELGGPEKIDTIYGYVPDDWTDEQLKAVESEIIERGDYTNTGYNQKR